MPRLVTGAMRLTIKGMLTLIRRWEDKHADHTDYRMRHLTTGLWQASQSLRDIRTGRIEPMQRQSSWDMPELPSLTDTAYAQELFRDEPVPLYAVEN